MDKLKELLMNHKTEMGAVLFFILYGALGIGLIDQNTFDNAARFAEVVVGIGLGHKVMKKVTE